MPVAWRITKAKHAQSAFDGEGCRRFGSRWSNPGTRVAFASQSLSLAVLEILVHLQASAPLAGYVVFTVEFSEDLVLDLDHTLLPENWRDFPSPPKLQEIGDAWVRNSPSALFRVPSAVIEHEYNYLINPLHGNFADLVICGPAPLDVDSRVFAGRR